MDKHSQARRERFIYFLSFTSTAIALCLALVFILAQAYVRWSTNQNFTFLGGGELEALTVSAFASIICLSCLYRPGRIPAKTD